MKQPEIPVNVVSIDDVYYVRATSALADDRTRVMKFGETFGVFNRYGDIEAVRPLHFGLFHAESRHLSRMLLYIDGRQPLLLGSSFREDPGALHVDLTNTDNGVGAGKSRRPGSTLHVYRSISVQQDCCIQSLRLLS